MTDRELETEFEDVVVCPYCGHRQQDDDGYYRLHGDYGVELGAKDND